jgi:Zn-dependent membrane protease YugP
MTGIRSVAAVAISSTSVGHAITGSSTAAPLVVYRRARPLAGVLAPVIRAARKAASLIDTDSGCIASVAAFA